MRSYQDDRLVEGSSQSPVLEIRDTRQYGLQVPARSLAVGGSPGVAGPQSSHFGLRSMEVRLVSRNLDAWRIRPRVSCPSDRLHFLFLEYTSYKQLLALESGVLVSDNTNVDRLEYRLACR